MGAKVVALGIGMSLRALEVGVDAVDVDEDDRSVEVGEGLGHGAIPERTRHFARSGGL